MYYKKLFLVFILFFITGCYNDYELNISKDKIEENIHFTLKDSDYDKANLINEIFNVATDYYDDDNEMGRHVIEIVRNNRLVSSYELGNFYQKTINKDKLNLSYTYDGTEFMSSNVFNSCFGDTYYDITDDYYVIKGYNSFKCLVEDKISVSIETDYRVIANNADKVRGNKYIWYFDSKNNLDHELYIQVSRLYKKNKQNYYSLLVMSIIILGILIYKFKRSNMFKIKANNDV